MNRGMEMSSHKELRKLINEIEIKVSDKDVWASVEISDALLDKVSTIILSQQITGHLHDKYEPLDILRACVLDEAERVIKEKAAIERLESMIEGNGNA